MTKPTVTLERALTLKALGLDPDAAKAALAAATTAATDTALKALPADASDEAKEEASEAARKAIRLHVATMFGIITQVKDELRKDGSVGSVLVGSFEGVNVATKNRVQAPRCYLPSVQETIETDFRSMPNRIGGNRMRMRADIFIVPMDNNYGYNYAVDLPLRDITNDPLAELRNDVNAALKAKPAGGDTKGEDKK